MTNGTFDSCSPLVLAELPIGGMQRAVIMQAPKNGFFYVLDRATGELLAADPFTTTTWAKSVNKKTGRPVVERGANYGEPASVRLHAGARRRPIAGRRCHSARLLLSFIFP